MGTSRGSNCRAITRDVQTDRADLGRHRLRASPVTRIARSPAGRVAFLVTQVAGQLGGQPPLEHRFVHFREEATRAGQRHSTFIGPVDEFIEPLVIS